MTATIAFPREPSDADTLLWRIEADAVHRSPMVAVALLDRIPSGPTSSTWTPRPT